jgi:membrane protein implicated in regulation of membrane protease activity
VAAWLAWAIAAVLLAVGEMLTPGLFFLGPVAVAAVTAALAAVFGAAVWLQLVVFGAGAAASLAILRPIAKAHLHLPPALRTGTAALEGAHATVLERVDADCGLVRIGGETWTARPYSAGEVFEAGVQVEVAKIEGATALVYL